MRNRIPGRKMIAYPVNDFGLSIRNTQPTVPVRRSDCRHGESTGLCRRRTTVATRAPAHTTNCQGSATLGPDCHRMYGTLHTFPDVTMRPSLRTPDTSV